MSKALHRLTAKEINAAVPGTALSDGGGLLFRSTGKGLGKWAFKFTSPDPDYRAAQTAKGNKSIQREQGLGAYPAVPLVTAREKATTARALLARGVDPIEDERRADDDVRQRAIALSKKATELAMTFGRYADEQFLPFAVQGFSNHAHVQQWYATFATDAAALRDQPVASITREDVLSILKPIWGEKPVTASRSRQRIERLFSHAIQNGHYKGDNPASWRQFDATLPAPTKNPRHHPAVPHDIIADFVGAIRGKQADSLAALMLEWITLAACRTGEARFAKWGEIDLDRRVWAISAERMKMRRDHVVPVTGRMVEILAEAKRRHPANGTAKGLTGSDFVFLSSQGKPLSEMAGLMLLRGMPDYKGYTGHGLRATFKTWAATETDFPRELIEEQLAHQLGAVERAYLRTSAIERRRAMMEAWAAVCAGDVPTGRVGNIVPLRNAGGKSET